MIVLQRFDAWLTSTWVTTAASVSQQLHRWRWGLALFVVLFSIADLLLTQSILTMVHGRGMELSEANPVMDPVIMSWWAWPIRVGIPLVVVVRDLRRQNYNLMAFAFLLYGAVVAWNAYIYGVVKATA